MNKTSGPRCKKTYHYGNFAFNGIATMATRHHNQLASRILWKLPLMLSFIMVHGFMQRGPGIFNVNNVISHLPYLVDHSDHALAKSKASKAFPISMTNH